MAAEHPRLALPGRAVSVCLNGPELGIQEPVRVLQRFGQGRLEQYGPMSGAATSIREFYGVCQSAPKEMAAARRTCMKQAHWL